MTQTKLPEYLASGEKARLIPVVSDGSKEGRATSILLANLSCVKELAEVFFGSLGLRLGARSSIDVYTEIVLTEKGTKEKLRPDGLIVINTGRSQWKALVEAKIGKAELDCDQVRDYMALAKKYNIDAVITISNQYSAMPRHHPIHFKKSDLKGVDLFHFSWMFILTEAILLLKSMGVKDEEQRFLLDEMVRYYDHPSVGVTSFSSMNAEWKDVNIKVRSGSNLTKTSEEVQNTVISWHQEARDLCLIMSRSLAVPVTLRLNRKHAKDPLARIKDDCETLAASQILACELDIPDAVSPLKVTADLTRRVVDCSMSLNAPKDKQRASAKLNWLLRQLKDTKHEDIFIKAYTMGRGNNPQVRLEDIRQNPDSLILYEGVEINPTAFDVMISVDLAGKFAGRNTFIEAVEKVVTDFYELAGQNLQGWTPPAPKVRKETADDIHEIGEEETVKLVHSKDGSDHIEEVELEEKTA